MELLEKELQVLENSDSVELEKLNPKDKTLSFFLDDTTLTEWKAAVVNENGEFQLQMNAWKVKRC
ncbi:MAG: hypothetical protein KI791_21200 [Cyclobacteriaceae bacterium]|nr:hypothetical protein [Cyclobacteriaceae bacterium SS2]